MRSSAQRRDMYNQKVPAATVGLKIAAVLPDMKTGFSAAINALVPIEQQVQGLLNAGNVPTITYPFYYAFAREMFGLVQRGVNGATLETMAQALHDKWVARGLTTARVIEIADTVFNVTVT